MGLGLLECVRLFWVGFRLFRFVWDGLGGFLLGVGLGLG